MSGAARCEQLEALQRALAEALHTADPAVAVRALAAREDLPSAWRQALAAASPRGVQLTERLVVNLRFDRLLAASEPARRAYAADPRGFAVCFAAFHRAHPACDWHPLDEARAFERHLEDKGI